MKNHHPKGSMVACRLPGIFTDRILMWREWDEKPGKILFQEWSWILRAYYICIFRAIYNDQTAEGIPPNGALVKGILPKKWPKHSG